MKSIPGMTNILLMTTDNEITPEFLMEVHPIKLIEGHEQIHYDRVFLDLRNVMAVSTFDKANNTIPGKFAIRFELEGFTSEEENCSIMFEQFETYQEMEDRKLAILNRMVELGAKHVQTN